MKARRLIYLLTRLVGLALIVIGAMIAYGSLINVNRLGAYYQMFLFIGFTIVIVGFFMLIVKIR